MYNSPNSNHDETTFDCSLDDVLRNVVVGRLPNNQHSGNTDAKCGKPTDDEGGLDDIANGGLCAGAGGEERQHGAHHRKDCELARESEGAKGHRQGVSEQ